MSCVSCFTRKKKSIKNACTPIDGYQLSCSSQMAHCITLRMEFRYIKKNRKNEWLVYLSCITWTTRNKSKSVLIHDLNKWTTFLKRITLCSIFYRICFHFFLIVFDSNQSFHSNNNLFLLSPFTVHVQGLCSFSFTVILDMVFYILLEINEISKWD